MRFVTVGDFVKEYRARLKLELISGRGNLQRKITTPEVNRPGLALAGFPDHFRAERVQIIGRGEQSFCIKAPAQTLTENIEKMFSIGEVPCLVLTRKRKAPQALVKVCRKFKVPLLRTALETADFVGELTVMLEDRLAPMIRAHGVLVDVYGLGVLIQGDAGIGKSECALELVKRGHLLVSDDMVEIRQKHGDILDGSCPEPLKHYMEVRGLGIIDIKLLFGIGSIMPHAPIGLAIELEAWDPAAHYERTGLERVTKKIIDVDIPLVRIPVSPGRNLAVLIEVASLNQQLKIEGDFPAERFNQRIIERMNPRAATRRVRARRT
ncbi:MAG: HPr(Ser) kinase/phosphatase [Elusimicrobia bacterium]|nr:MAG: HPr(Ser) kinase/phosphatase [Elusimicrobiota bacterium]